MQIHLATDNKFIDYFISRQRNFFPEINCRYFIISDRKHLIHVRSTGVQICSSEKQSIINVWKGQNIDKVYIHFFIDLFYEPVLALPKDVKLYWVFWGAEGFSRPSLYSKFLDKFSLHFYRILFYEGRKNKIFNRGILLPSTWEKYRRFKKNNRLAREAFQRVDYFCHYLIEDYKLLKKRFGIKAEFIDFHYCSISDLSPETKQIDRNKTIAFIGNSGSEANNHISLLRLFDKLGMTFEKIYCPLSYSGKKEYVEAVMREGTRLYGDRFVALLDFISKSDYDNIIDTAGKFFHNHYRSQAYGNIAYQLFNGGEVYMSNTSSLYRYLTQNKLSIGIIYKNRIAPPSQIENNREYIRELLSEPITNEKYKSILGG